MSPWPTRPWCCGPKPAPGHSSSASAATSTSGAERRAMGVAEERVPTVIADNAHIVYRIHGSVTAGQNSPLASFKRLVSRQKSAAVREVHAVKGVSFVAY